MLKMCKLENTDKYGLIEKILILNNINLSEMLLVYYWKNSYHH